MGALLIGAAVLAVVLFYGLTSQAATGGCNSVTCNITADESTWPSGDVVWNVARAIARAEGANVAGTVPDTLNNPGDISDGGATYGFEMHSGSAVTHFPDKQTGWQWLYNKLHNAFVLGQSHVYSPNMTWTDLAQKWAGDWQNWVTNVTGPLNVSQDDRVGDYFGT
jgi:hypothetical protein